MLLINIVFLSIVLCAVKCDLDLRAGAECITEGHNGTCVPLYKCATAALTYVFNKQDYVEDIPKFPDVCSIGNNEEPIVCCTDCFKPKNEVFRNSIVDPKGVIVSKSGPKALNMCYEYFATLPYKCRGGAVVSFKKDYDKNKKCYTFSFGAALAIGGRNAERWEFPHMALLGYGETQEDAQWLCGGTIISERFILTAGHCVYSTAVGNVTFAALGLLKRSDPPEYWKIYKIKRAIAHPEYKPPSKYHDIALLETENEISFGRDVLPACLSIPGDHGRVTASAAGWGNLGASKGVANNLQVVELQEIDELTCLLDYPPHRLMKNGFNVTTQMCFGSQHVIADTCQGDSGGPLQSDNQKCLYTVEGVTSFGKECGKLGSPGIYTRVKHYVPWIENIVWPDQ